jgi:predicted transcriptional regulator of viral defense system
MTTLSFYQKIAAQRHVTTRSAAQLAGMSMTAASMALQRLSAEGLVTRIKAGSWLVGSAVREPAALVAAVARPYDAYLSGWSALRHHGRIQQFPETHFGVTLGRPAEMKVAGVRVRLHHVTPELFTGYDFVPELGGHVASAEKALFDLAYFAAVGRGRLSGHVPETELNGLRQADIQGWLRRIPTIRIRTRVEQKLRALREENSSQLAGQ